jgi:outer membrane lipoprotein-sorting protein
MTPSDLPILDELGRDLSRVARRTAAEPPPRHRARRARRLLVAAAVLAAAAVGAGVLTGVGDGPSLAERAYAAVAPREDTIRHVVAEATSSRRDGEEVRQREEFWVSPDGCRVRVRYERPPGTLVSETTQDRDETRTYDPEQDRVSVYDSDRFLAIQDPVATFRDLYRRGRVRQAGRTRFDGREVVRFVMSDFDLTAVYFFDAETFMPRGMQLSVDGRPGYGYRILLHEALPARAADEVLAMPERPGAEVVRHDSFEAPPAGPRRPCEPSA